MARVNNPALKKCAEQLEKFIAEGEQEIFDIEEYMCLLTEDADPGSEEEALIRRYIDYIATIDPYFAQRDLDELESDCGYKTHVVLAAARLAERLHEGQVDKGGMDYFRGHLLHVAAEGMNWKEKTVGLLHDAAEDTPHTAQEVVVLLREETVRMTAAPEDMWMKIMAYRLNLLLGPACHLPSDDDWQEIEDALTALNHHLCATREEYIARVGQNELAAKVKIYDLGHNQDLSRIPHPTAKDRARAERYEKEIEQLSAALHPFVWGHGSAEDDE